MDFQYYPTPPSLAKRAWDKFSNSNFRRILDPSGGTGELAIAAKDFSGFRYLKIDCCEIDVKHHPELKRKGINVVGLDFMDFNFGAVYSHIIMNPPFRCGAAHLLRAWDILWDGEIVAILNAETIKNPFSLERQQLSRLINENGTVEFIEHAFDICEAERKTSVEVALVHLKKLANVREQIIGNLLDGLEQDRGICSGAYKEDYFPALPNSAVENAVIVFQAAVSSMKASIFAEAKASYYARLLQDKTNILGTGPSKSDNVTDAAWMLSEMDSRYDLLKEKAWKLILTSTNVSSKLSQKAFNELLSNFESVGKLEFSVKNIYGFLCGLIEKQHEIQQGMLCDVFDLFSKYHSENVVFYKGWKSNDKHRSCGRRIKISRLIVPGNSVDSFRSGIRYETINMLKDIDRVFAHLDGKVCAENGLVDVFDKHFSELYHGARISGSYFDVRFYPGVGTIHFYPRNKVLIERLNRFVGACRQWIPNDPASVKRDFWTQYEQAEKFDADFRKVYADASRKNFNYARNSLANVGVADIKEHQVEANQIASDAMELVLKKAGFDTEFQLADATTAARNQLCFEI